MQVPAIRRRILSQLANVDEVLAGAVAAGLGLEVPDPQPMAAQKIKKPEVSRSGALSLFARPGATGIRTRRVAILVAPGVTGGSSIALHEALTAQGAVPRYVAAQLGTIETAEGEAIEAEITLETAPAVLFDALAIPDGKAAGEFFGAAGPVMEFVKEQYRHCKAILAIGSGTLLLDKVGIPNTLPSGEDDSGLLRFEPEDAADGFAAFINAISRHRHFDRQTDPPIV